MNDVRAYVDRSIELAFEKRSKYHSGNKAGYSIARFVLGRGAVLVAYYIKDAIHRVECDGSQDGVRDAFRECKKVCERHYEERVK